MKKIVMSLLVLTVMQPALAQGIKNNATTVDAASSQVRQVQTAAPQQKQTNQSLKPWEQGTELGAYNDTYAGITKFYGDDIVGHETQNAVKSIMPQKK